MARRRPQKVVLGATVALAAIALACGSTEPAKSRGASKPVGVPSAEPAPEPTTPTEPFGGEVIFGTADGGPTEPSEKDAGCATGYGETSRRPVHLLLVVDRSGSMRGVKWTAETAALKAVVEKFAADADPQLSVGLDFFADGAAGDRTVEEPLGPMDDSKSARIRALIDKMEPTTDTPTFGALSLAYRTLDGYQPTGALKDGTKVVVLMTDGKPTPDTAHALSGRSEADWIHGIVEEAHRKGVLTFAVGVGDFPPNPDYDPKFLGKTAVVGGTQRSPQCNPSEIRDPSNLCYFQVTPPKSGAPTKAEVDRLTQDFVDTLQTIRGQLGACEYKLEFAPGASVDFSKVNVVFRDESNQEETFPKDSVNGWSYDNEAAPTSVRLAGAACDRVRNTTGKVTIVLGCSSIGIR